MIYTGYFAKASAYRGAGLIPVSIARYPAKWYKGVTCKVLAPSGEMLRMSESQYVAVYNERILGKLDAAKLVRELQGLGENVVLLCFERPEEFCHRHLVAKWLRDRGTPCEEYQFSNPPSDEKKPEAATLPLF